MTASLRTRREAASNLVASPQAADDLAFGQSLGGAAFDVVAGGLTVAHADDRDDVRGAVGRSVTAAAEMSRCRPLVRPLLAGWGATPHNLARAASLWMRAVLSSAVIRTLRGDGAHRPVLRLVGDETRPVPENYRRWQSPPLTFGVILG